MIKNLKVDGFRAVPYLETSKLMQTHKKCVAFSTEKPNVIVGANGTGKSALLNALSMLTLTYYTDTSNFDRHYLVMSDSDSFWYIDKDEWWRHDHKFLHGLSADTDLAPALYYRPNRLPGNEKGIAHSMCMGYSTEAKAMGELIRDKSSGQKSQAIQQQLLDVLTGTKKLTYTWDHWGSKKEPLKIDHSVYSGDLDYKINTMLLYYSSRREDGQQLVIADEPEQSLDALAEIRLWQAIANHSPDVQVIVATHSIYPFLHPDKFNIIETTKGYCASVQDALKYVVAGSKLQ